MEGELLETFCDEIQETIFDVGKDLLKTENFKVNIEPLSVEGIDFSLKLEFGQ